MKPKVIFLPHDRSQDIPSAIKAHGFDGNIKKGDFAAIKIHFGEKGNIGYIRPKLIKPLIKMIKEAGAYPFLTDANTIYRGERTDAYHHLLVAAEHEFHTKFLMAPVIIADGLRGSSYIEVDVGFDHFKKIKVAEAIYNADYIVSIAHFKGHELCGMGGAIKNLGMGCASRAGKYEQHCDAVPNVNIEKCTACGACIKWCGGGALELVQAKKPANTIADGRSPLKTAEMTIQLNPSKCAGCGQCILACEKKVFSLPWDGTAKSVQERIAEYACGVMKNKRAVFINFLTFITPLCDCFKTIAKPIVPDIGILISDDPVAIDQASTDLVEKQAGRDILKEATGMNGRVQIEHAEKLGLGNRNYQLI